MTQRRPLMAANWKMNKTHREAVAFAEALDDALDEKQLPGATGPDIVLFAPFTALPATSEHRLNCSSAWHLGAQTMDFHDSGAYTGEISGDMLQALGITSVLVGHSERRQYYNETDETCNKKLHAAFKHNLIPILCVGETLEEREAGQTDVVVMRQMRMALDGVTTQQREQLVIAYEPIWAIGTGKVCDAAEANRTIAVIRREIGLAHTRILYGGSMKPDNVAELMKQPDIDGGLVGGASLDVDSFMQLVAAAVPVTA
ncbi:MAG: triose-phosphate isomerase [Cyanobacteria bacterium HKST-UBA06]|nr:triose-phosphate isomerase [Cyanobacteria bacterium HKST-UBA04]MCA9806412.1 triose-phosphate isomerase [Cyanobacteria bacterium HKST-UBA06]MCA9841506.1 triose-phosphate isomerase [Cyanobacteria bacterium HKST-UBA03]